MCFYVQPTRMGEKNSQLDEKSDESLWFNGPFKQTTPTEQTGTLNASINAPLERGPRPDRLRLDHFVRYGAMKCHRLTSAKVVFINLIQALWIAVATTEGPGDMWYAAEKARRCGFDSSRRKRDTMETADLQRRSESRRRTVTTRRDEKEPTNFSVTRLMPVICAHLNLLWHKKRPERTRLWDIKKKAVGHLVRAALLREGYGAWSDLQTSRQPSQVRVWAFGHVRACLHEGEEKHTETERPYRTPPSQSSPPLQFRPFWQRAERRRKTSESQRMQGLPTEPRLLSLLASSFTSVNTAASDGASV